MVWNTKRGKGAGHVAICTGEGNTKEFYSYDQNWNGIKIMQKVKHNYTCVLGVLRPRNPNELYKKEATVVLTNFKQGDKVKIEFEFADTGAKRIRNGISEKLIEYDKCQFWIPEKITSNNICKTSGIMCYCPEGAIKYIVECQFAECRQLWIPIQNISK